MRLSKYNNYNEETKGITGEPKPAYYYFQSELIPNDYTEIHTIKNIEDFGFNISGFDYKYSRDILEIEVELLGWENLSAEEKTIAAIHKIGTNLQRAEAFNNDYNLMDAKGEIYHEKVSVSRLERLNKVKSKIHNRLGHILIGSYTGPEIILSEVTENVILMFQNEGLGGVCNGNNSEGLFDYINETIGTSYAGGNGLRSKDWIPFGYSNCSELSTELLSILQNGI